MKWHRSFALRMTRASSRNVGKFYRTVKLSEKNLCFIHIHVQCHVNNACMSWLAFGERFDFLVSTFSATRLAYCCTTSGVELRFLQRVEHMASVRWPSSWATLAHGIEPPKKYKKVQCIEVVASHKPNPGKGRATYNICICKAFKMTCTCTCLTHSN